MMHECRECGAGNRYSGGVVAYNGRYTVTLTPEQVETFDLALRADGTMELRWAEPRREGMRRADGKWLELETKDCGCGDG